MKRAFAAPLLSRRSPMTTASPSMAGWLAARAVLPAVHREPPAQSTSLNHPEGINDLAVN